MKIELIRRGKIEVINCYIAALLFLTLSFISCGDSNNDNECLEIYTFPFKEGDLVFRQGRGAVSRVVLYADTEGVYSHIGIMVKDSGEMKVVHAVPGEPDFNGDVDRVKMESVKEFFNGSKASHGCVMRGRGDSLTNQRAAEHAKRIYKKGVLFDHDYDHNDTVKMYCTELIYHAYKYEGVDLVEDRFQSLNAPGLNGIYIFPSTIFVSEYLNNIYHY